ncbi:DNA polymerase/3'-5' exonuclease PolX [Posidoniimonas polymericola]|uniref:DNA polymerase beta n=1 Tax=Posidoniimonas polymericola TaxID=2528002 RepID=A0A5C5YL08_9BACT|nr:DNA polymerase/3'-5' exonuclease PolX [Posidoniimonas polymericola]TWT75488.1 DNA polymerase/3'-5' exonuclease PolX [Posidoniimonas polymericola]
MTNRDIAAVFDQVADLLEFQNANPFRVRAYRNGARKLKDLADPLSRLVADDADLTAIDGIGKDLAEKIATLVQTGSLPMLTELEQQVPASVLPMMRVPGLGPKKAAALYNDLKITSLDMLRAACEEGRVRELKGFGKKTEETILAGIALAERATDRIYWSAADEIVQELLAHLRPVKAIKQLEAAGSYRRGKETVGDIDLLADATDVDAVMDRLGEFPAVAEVIARGDTKMSVRLDSQLQVDLRVVPSESFGAALQYFTGSKEHNVEVRGRAKQQGLRVNEWGVFRTTDDGEQGERVAGATEDEVYAALGLPTFPPELREARGEFDLAEEGELPRLVEVGDLRGDLHMHTTATDGKATLREMIDAARDRGHEYIAITDHSKRVSMAGGLDADRLRAQWAEIDALRPDYDDIVVLKGIECDILESGEMDLPDEVLAEADWVIASLHYGQKQPREKIMQRLLFAVEHPSVSIIAHPTGRLINRRESYDLDVDQLIAAARQHGKLLELNANPARLDLDDSHCALAKRAGVPIVVSSDAHHTGGLDVLPYGVKQARRAGLTAADVANTLPWKQLKPLLATPASQLPG